jgi:hypothetical protein
MKPTEADRAKALLEEVLLELGANARAAGLEEAAKIVDEYIYDNATDWARKVIAQRIRAHAKEAKMPRKENDDQRDIVNSIIAEGGWAKKWASAYALGVPDLVCALPTIGNFVMEVKRLTHPMGKLLGVTAKQNYEMMRNIRGGGRSVIGVVVTGRDRLRFFSLAPAWTDSTADVRVSRYSVEWDPKRKRYVGISGVILQFFEREKDLSTVVLLDE